MIDLRELLDERSANPPGAETLRLTQIEKRIVQRRHRRVAVAAAAVVLLLFGGYLLRPTPHTPPPPNPAVTPSTVLGFPAWTGGARLAAADSASLGSGEVRVTWKPKTLNIMWSVRCDGLTAEQSSTFMVAVSANGHPLADVSCDGGGYSSPDVQQWHIAGFKVGEPATMTAVAADPPGPGTVSLAVYEMVAFHEYPFPPRPTTLKPLDCAYLAGKPGVDSDPHDPLRPMTMTIDWSEFVQFHVRSQTPGYLHIAVNGQLLRTISFWSYDAPDLGSWLRLETRPGERVTITLTPEHFTGAWVFYSYPGTGRHWSTACF